MRSVWCLLSILLLGVPCAADEWFAAECDSVLPSSLAKEFPDSRSYDEAVRNAAPESPLYLPHPFPESDQQVVGNFRWWYEKTWSSTSPDKLPEEERALTAGLRNKTLSFVVKRVANWTPQRCERVRPRSFFYLVQVLDRSGAEIARFSENRYGLPKSYITVEPENRAALAPRLEASLPDLGQFESVLEKELDTELRDPQLVFSQGNALQCRDLLPCVAIRGKDAFYVYSTSRFFQNRILRFSSESERMTLEERSSLTSSIMLGEGGRDELLEKQARLNRFVSLSDVWVLGEEVNVPSLGELAPDRSPGIGEIP